MPRGLSSSQRQAYLSRDIDFDKPHLVRAVGALMGFLRSNGILNQLEDTNALVALGSIEHMRVGQSVQLDLCTLRSLQIFKVTLLVEYSSD
jgi:hypothetical protein